MITNQPTISLGTLTYGQPHTFTYELENEGKEDAHIISIVEGCKSCTKALIDKNTIPPGDKALLTVTYTPGSTGVTLRGISILYKDGWAENTQELKLSFKSQVV